MKEIEIEVVGPSLARLVVHTGGSVARASSGAPPEHALGRVDAPRFRLREAWSPDDALELSVLASGALEHPERLAEDAAWRYLEWAEGAAAEAGGDLLAALPRGAYRLVRRALDRTRPSRVLLGNEHVPAPSNALGVLDGPGAYAAAFGADGPPSLATPLVGLALLESTGSANLDVTLFFELARAPDRAGDAVLVVPIEGELVVDLGARFRRDATAVAAWSARGGDAFAARLARSG